MDFKALLVLVMLLNTILLISADDTIKDSNEKIVQEDGESTTDAIDESKYGRGGGFGGRGGGFGGRGGFGGGRGGWRGGYGGGWRGGYGGGWRGGYGGWRGGYGGYCPYGCCYWGYYGGCLRCCYYPGDSTEASIDAKPYN